MNEMHDKLLASLEAADARLVALEKQQLDVEERAIAHSHHEQTMHGIYYGVQ